EDNAAGRIRRAHDAGGGHEEPDDGSDEEPAPGLLAQGDAADDARDADDDQEDAEQGPDGRDRHLGPDQRDRADHDRDDRGDDDRGAHEGEKRRGVPRMGSSHGAHSPLSDRLTGTTGDAERIEAAMAPAAARRRAGAPSGRPSQAAAAT